MDNGRLRDSSSDGKGRVYVIGCQVGCKIGWTSGDPIARVRALQTGNPYPLHLVGSVVGTMKMEAAAHERFDEYRMAGEWFNMNPFDALMWLTYEGQLGEKTIRKGFDRPHTPYGCTHSIDHALDAYGHGPATIWTAYGINAVIGRWPSDDEWDEMLYGKRLFKATVSVGGRKVQLYSQESFGEDDERFELSNPFDA